MTTTATRTMIDAIKSLPPSERLTAAQLAESVYFAAMRSPSMADLHNDAERHEVAGEAAAAEVLYRFA